jgi:L-glutamine-phosphate cytidylyltransferase
MNQILPVILSAGMGTRLGDKNENQPKALLEINEKKLISYQLEKLQTLGFSEVLIIVGYKASLIKRVLGNDFHGMTIHYVSNKDFSKSGTAYSFFKAKSFWNQNKPSILMLHSDIFYDLSILDLLPIQPQCSLLVADEHYANHTNDEMVVFANNKTVYKVEKGPNQMNNAVGEVVGINLFLNTFCECYFTFLENFFQNNSNKKSHWEQTLKPFLENNTQCPLNYLGIEKKLWVNINYSDDLQYARNTIVDNISEFKFSK